MVQSLSLVNTRAITPSTAVPTDTAQVVKAAECVFTVANGVALQFNAIRMIIMIMGTMVATARIMNTKLLIFA